MEAQTATVRIERLAAGEWEASFEGRPRGPRATSDFPLGALNELGARVGGLACKVVDDRGGGLIRVETATPIRDCANCRGRGVEVLFQLPRDCESCQGWGFVC